MRSPRWFLVAARARRNRPAAGATARRRYCVRAARRRAAGGPAGGRRRDAGRPSSSGTCSRHTASAKGQRVWKRQPAGGAIGLGTSPSMRRRAWRRCPARRPAARGYRDAAARRRPARPVLPRRCVPRYITATRSAMWRTTPRSWLISTKVRPSSRIRSLQQVHHLRLDRDIERRDRLVADDQLRAAGQRPGDGDALALAAAELVRPAPRRFRPQPDPFQQLAPPAPARAPRGTTWCSFSGSAIASSTVMRGSRLAKGSWKISCMSRRRARSAAGRQRAQVLAHRSAPRRRSGSISRSASRPRVDLPQPLSPTIASTAAPRHGERDAVHRAHRAARPAEARRAPGNASAGRRVRAAARHAASTWSSGARQQAAAWPAATSPSGGWAAQSAPREGAARREAAAGRRAAAGRARCPRCWPAGPAPPAMRGHRAQQADGVGMLGPGEQRRRRRALRRRGRHTSPRPGRHGRRPRRGRG